MTTAWPRPAPDCPWPWEVTAVRVRAPARVAAPDEPACAVDGCPRPCGGVRANSREECTPYCCAHRKHALRGLGRGLRGEALCRWLAGRAISDGVPGAALDGGR